MVTDPNAGGTGYAAGMRIELRALPWFAAAFGAAVAVAVLSAPVDLGRWWAGEIDLAGRRVFEPPPPDAAAVAEIDFALLHSELWPAWVAAPPGADEPAYQRLAAEVAPDPYLSRLVKRMHRLAEDDAAGNAPRLLYQVWAWNRYCDMIGVPWRLTAGIQVLDPRDAKFYVKSYRVLSDTPTRVGSGYWRTRVVRRVDDLSVVEGYLGLTSDHESGAVVVAERVAAFAIERVWPLLDPELQPEQFALDATFGPAIRAAAKRSLHPTDLDVLEKTAADRFWLERAVAQIHQRASCGSRFQIGFLPFDGLHHRDLIEVRRYAAATADSHCPDVTHIEAMALTTRSAALQETAGLRQALEALSAWVARAIAVHEARHAADDAEEREIRCDDCPPEITGVARLEVSAYLASFAHPDVSEVSLLQACTVEQVDAVGRGAWIRFLSERLGDVCENGPGEDFVARARGLEKELFHREAPIVLHPDFPAHLPLERDLGPPDELPEPPQ